MSVVSPPSFGSRQWTAFKTPAVEDGRVNPRFPIVLCCGAFALAGCADSSGPTSYARNVKAVTDLKVKPAFQKKIAAVVDQTFGASPRAMKVPKGTILKQGGLFLANHAVVEGLTPKEGKPIKYSKNGKEYRVEGGYALYRLHCLHCHGVSGDGEGPTAEFLWPKPRDYRLGLFKFTSTASLKKPTRDDLRKTIMQGIDNTSMPAFHAQMTPDEIEEVIDYVIFLSMRGQVEYRLLDTVRDADEKDEEALSQDLIDESIAAVLKEWKDADSLVVSPPAPRSPEPPRYADDVAADREYRASVLRGRDLFLKLDCKDCHGVLANGDGKSFIDKRVFDEIVFQMRPVDEVLEEQFALKIEQEGLDDQTGAEARKKIEETRKNFETQFRDAWKNSKDDWGNPLRPANLNLGVYKGGRRPIDIYWRINKGINGAKMPAHDLKPRELWDLVNFVLDLPYERTLLKEVEDRPPIPSAVAAQP